jgi:hypothetical protein
LTVSLVRSRLTKTGAPCRVVIVEVTSPTHILPAQKNPDSHTSHIGTTIAKRFQTVR